MGSAEAVDFRRDGGKLASPDVQGLRGVVVIVLFGVAGRVAGYRLNAAGRALVYSPRVLALGHESLAIGMQPQQLCPRRRRPGRTGPHPWSTVREFANAQFIGVTFGEGWLGENAINIGQEVFGSHGPAVGIGQQVRHPRQNVGFPCLRRHGTGALRPLPHTTRGNGRGRDIFAGHCRPLPERLSKRLVKYTCLSPWAVQREGPARSASGHRRRRIAGRMSDRHSAQYSAAGRSRELPKWGPAFRFWAEVGRGVGGLVPCGRVLEQRRRVGPCRHCRACATALQCIGTGGDYPGTPGLDAPLLPGKSGHQRPVEMVPVQPLGRKGAANWAQFLPGQGGQVGDRVQGPELLVTRALDNRGVSHLGRGFLRLAVADGHGDCHGRFNGEDVFALARCPGLRRPGRESRISSHSRRYVLPCHRMRRHPGNLTR